MTGFAQTTGGAGSHAFRYDGTPGSGGTMLDLGTLGGSNSYGCGINDDAFVVGFSFRADVGGTSIAALWRPDMSVVDLDAWLDAVNPTQGSLWTLSRADAITESGMITGYGTYNDGVTNDYRAFVLDASSLVPEPSMTITLLGVGSLGLLRRRRGNETGIAPRKLAKE